MQTYEKICEMFAMQKKLNDETNGENWELGHNKNGKIISWKRCIYMECAELIDSFAWKHWKNVNAAVDIDNVRIEIADIWHFIMSLVLENAHARGLNLKEITQEIVSVSGFNEFCYEPYNINNYNIYELINEIEAIIHQCSGFDLKIHDLVTNYFRLAMKCGVNLSELFKIYVAKNVLNKFRQDNGYKDGAYKKIWNGKEDNVVLNEILLQNISKMDEIYAKLSDEYKKIK